MVGKACGSGHMGAIFGRDEGGAGGAADVRRIEDVVMVGVPNEHGVGPRKGRLNLCLIGPQSTERSAE